MVATSPPSLRTSLLAAALAVAPLFPAPGSAQDFRANVVGRVLDAETDAPVEGAAVSVAGLEGSYLTDALGQFRLDRLQPGSWEIQVRHVAYGLQSDTLVVTAGEQIVLEFRVATRPIEVAGIQVTARSRDVDTSIARGTRFDGMTSEEVDQVRTRVSTMGDLVRAAHVPGLTVREQSDSICIESNRFRRRFQNSPTTCNTVQVVVDDVLMQDPVSSLLEMDPQRVDRFEIVPSMEAGVLYGGMGRYGVLRIYTEDGRGPALGFEDYAPIGPRWALSFAFNARGGSTLYNGTVRVRHDSGVSVATPYTEKSTASPGLEGSVRYNTGRYGFLGMSLYGNTGSSTGTFQRVGGQTESFERDLLSVGTDLWFAFSLLHSNQWNAQLGLGPSISWQTLKLSQGNSNRIGNPTQSSTPEVDWSDRHWWAPGGHLSAELSYDLSHVSGIFVGVVFRALGTSANGAWSPTEEADILRSTGSQVQVEYSSGIATSVSFRTGFRWYPGVDPIG